MACASLLGDTSPAHRHVPLWSTEGSYIGYMLTTSNMTEAQRGPWMCDDSALVLFGE